MDTPQPFNVLVADDSPLYRKLVEQALARQRYSVLFANDGRQAVDRAPPALSNHKLDDARHSRC